MPVPVLPEEFEPIQWGGSVCDAFKQLIATNERLAQIFEWMFNPDTGEVSDDFIASFYDRMMPIGSVIIWTSSSVPSDKWALCNGQSLNRTTYAALFSRIGTQFGSNDATTFKVPNLTNRVPAGAGGDYTLGEEFGVDEVELTELEVPLVSHYHGTGRRAAGAGAQAEAEANASGSSWGQPIHSQKVVSYLGPTAKVSGHKKTFAWTMYPEISVSKSI